MWLVFVSLNSAKGSSSLDKGEVCVIHKLWENPSLVCLVEKLEKVLSEGCHAPEKSEFGVGGVWYLLAVQC